jgi:hypothetical protein
MCGRLFGVAPNKIAAVTLSLYGGGPALAFIPKKLASNHKTRSPRLS